MRVWLLALVAADVAVLVCLLVVFLWAWSAERGIRDIDSAIGDDLEG